jgi:hypothetical protein
VFLAREILLALALNQVTTDFVTVERKVKTGAFAGDCTRLGSFDTQGIAQLRFIDQNSYVLEVICDQFQANPVLVEKHTLPLLSLKAYGDSGLVSGAVENQLELQVLGRSGLVHHASSGEVNWSYGKLPADQPFNGPLTMCAGYGLKCCQESEEQGHGKAIQGAIDCPKTCYEGCWARPVVLGFNTQPFYDLTTRTMEVQAGEEITFDYTVSETQQDNFADTPIKEQKNGISVMLAVVQGWFKPQDNTQTALRQVVVAFGDGQQTELTDLQGTTTHAYTCAKPSCTYTASVKAVNAQGVEAQETRLGQVTITVKP